MPSGICSSIWSPSGVSSAIVSPGPTPSGHWISIVVTPSASSSSELPGLVSWPAVALPPPAPLFVRGQQQRVQAGSAPGGQVHRRLAAGVHGVNVDAARLLVYRTGWLMDRGEPATRATSRAKYAAVEAAKHAAAAAAEIFAGYALADEYPIKKFTAYVNMLAVGEGTANVQRILIAEDALGIKNANRHPVKNRLRGK